MFSSKTLNGELFGYLYVKVSTFGSAGLYEYLGLFVWGLGAEAAQKTLTGLQLPSR